MRNLFPRKATGIQQEVSCSGRGGLLSIVYQSPGQQRKAAGHMAGRRKKANQASLHNPHSTLRVRDGCNCSIPDATGSPKSVVVWAAVLGPRGGCQTSRTAPPHPLQDPSCPTCLHSPRTPRVRAGVQTSTLRYLGGWWRRTMDCAEVMAEHAWVWVV